MNSKSKRQGEGSGGRPRSRRVAAGLVSAALLVALGTAAPLVPQMAEARAVKARAPEARAPEAQPVEARPVTSRTVREGVRRVVLAPKPGWSISGVWSPGGETLLLVDAVRSRVLEYSRSGELRRQHTVPMEGTTAFSRPSWIRPWTGGYIVEQEDAGFVTVSPEFEAREGFDLMEATRSTDLKNVAVFLWAPLSSEDLVAFGDVQLASGEWKTGLLRVRLDHPPRVEVIAELEGDPEDLDMYLMGLQYLTSLDGRGYFVDMSETPPSLLEVRVEEDGSAATRRLPVFTDRSRHGPPFLRPYLSELGAVNQVPGVFAELERSFMVSGVYGWEGRLFLLIRRPRHGAEGSTWSLTRIDPDTGAPGGRIDLPTTAPHVTVIPGAESWAVLEKGRVEGFGQQDIPTLLLIPGSHFRGE